MSLLDKAKKVPLSIGRKSNITEEHEELAIAWLRSEVAWKQVCRATSKKTTISMHLWLKSAYQSGRLVIKK